MHLTRAFIIGLVDEKLSMDLSGYEHNGVVPIQTKVKYNHLLNKNADYHQP